VAKNPEAPEGEVQTTEHTDAPTNVAAAGTDTTAAPAAAAAAPSGDSRSIVLTLDQQAVTDLADGRAVGSTIARKDYILKRWGQRVIGRGGIAKELTRLQGKEVPYQIVFQATGKVPGGPAPTEAPAPTPAPAADGASS